MHRLVNALGSNIVLTDDDQNVLVRFEEQAAIIQDAYLVTVERKPPKDNKDYKGGAPKFRELYRLFMGEFRQWYEELR